MSETTAPATPPAETAKEVLDFWLGELGLKQWFGPESAKVDHLIVERLGPAFALAEAGKLDDWQETPQGALALCVLLDQVPRNCFRGQARAFGTDSKALAVSRRAIERGFDQAGDLDDFGRVFLYMPFEHSENLADQERAIELMRLLGGGEDWVKYAIEHRDLIAEFGRFPHRNIVLGRPCTMAEREFLRSGESGFGQGGAGAVFGLDHIVVAAPDLERTADAWRELGFTLTGRGHHDSWATANYCVMFGDHYIELLGRNASGPLPPGLDACLAGGGGIFAMALGASEGAAAAEFLDACGVDPLPVEPLSRMATGPVADQKVHFELVHPREPDALGLRSFVCAQKTRDLIWQPSLLDHANGAVEITGFSAPVSGVDDGLAERYGALLGGPNVVQDAGSLAINLWGIAARQGPGAKPEISIRTGWGADSQTELNGVTLRLAAS